jgi:hypothetical protein
MDGFVDPSKLYPRRQRQAENLSQPCKIAMTRTAMTVFLLVRKPALLCKFAGDAAPKLLLCGQQQVLIEWIGGNRDLHPFTPAGDNRERRHPAKPSPGGTSMPSRRFAGRLPLGERKVKLARRA